MSSATVEREEGGRSRVGEAMVVSRIGVGEECGDEDFPSVAGRGEAGDWQEDSPSSESGLCVAMHEMGELWLLFVSVFPPFFWPGNGS